MPRQEGSEHIRFSVRESVASASPETEQRMMKQFQLFESRVLEPLTPRLRKQMERTPARDVDLDKLMRLETNLDLTMFRANAQAKAEQINTLYLGASTLYITSEDRYRLRPSAPALLEAMRKEHPSLAIQLLPDQRMSVDELPDIADDLNQVLHSEVASSIDPQEYAEHIEQAKAAIATGQYASGNYRFENNHYYGSILPRKSAGYDFGMIVLLEQLSKGRAIYAGDVQTGGAYKFLGKAGRVKNWEKISNGIHSFIYNDVDPRFAAQWVRQSPGITHEQIVRSISEDTSGIGKTIYYKSKRR